MSNHYLIDHFVSPLGDAPVIDVAEPSNGQTVTNGAFIVRVPNNVQVASPQPATLSALLTQKYAGLLARFAGFANIVYDDMLDTSGVNFATNPVGIFGDRANVAIASGQTLETVAIPLSLTPSVAVLTWEVFSYTYSDPKSGLFTRTYNELASSPSTATVSVSFNNGSTWGATTDSASISISGGDQGNQLILRFTNVTSGRLYLGSWALVY